MDEDMLAMQQAAQQRVRRMQERSRRLCAGGPTFGAGITQEKPQPQPVKKEKGMDERWLLLLLLLMLSQNGGSRSLLILLAYLLL